MYWHFATKTQNQQKTEKKLWGGQQHFTSCLLFTCFGDGLQQQFVCCYYWWWWQLIVKFFFVANTLFSFECNSFFLFSFQFIFIQFFFFCCVLRKFFNNFLMTPICCRMVLVVCVLLLLSTLLLRFIKGGPGGQLIVSS